MWSRFQSRCCGVNNVTDWRVVKDFPKGTVLYSYNPVLIFSYLCICTYDLYGPVRYVFDACRSITREGFTALEIETFLGSVKWQRAPIGECPLGPKKVENLRMWPHSFIYRNICFKFSVQWSACLTSFRNEQARGLLPLQQTGETSRPRWDQGIVYHQRASFISRRQGEYRRRISTKRCCKFFSATMTIWY